MENNNGGERKKRGRPHKLNPATITKKIRVSETEANYLKTMAALYSMTITSYIKTFALTGKLEIKHKHVNQEIIAAIAIIKNIGQNVNALVHKNNRGDFLSPVDRQNLQQWLAQLMAKVKKLENYFYDSES